ncbi:ubiquitin carboxyl terminal hydrolase isozyme [Echinococcus multilocularis]|uniref:Ubiquitin carboxyl terminal hydrolase isozyme n=1 Tax=Echinococcus multilocularis TaxID=6211 RepID=A0A0S4MP89_ECHMU|nr:ubiquitin carboxyl terminal hydrolase isozyme [Echinococcus multilocularis]
MARGENATVWFTAVCNLSHVVVHITVDDDGGGGGGGGGGDDDVDGEDARHCKCLCHAEARWRADQLQITRFRLSQICEFRLLSAVYMKGAGLTSCDTLRLLLSPFAWGNAVDPLCLFAAADLRIFQIDLNKAYRSKNASYLVGFV